MASRAFEDNDSVPVAPAFSTESAGVDAANAPIDPDLLLVYSNRDKIYRLSRTLLREDWDTLKADGRMISDVEAVITHVIDNLESLHSRPVGEKLKLAPALHELATARAALALAGNLATSIDLRRAAHFYDNIALCRRALNQAVLALSAAER
jgi:hypothetical protein